MSNNNIRTTGEVVDLFCGVGALSHGLLRAGLTIKAGYDVDRNCKYAYEKNNKATFYARDVAKLTAQEIQSHFTGTAPSVLAGCAPCQPFSTYKHRYEADPRWELVEAFAHLAAEVKSDFVTMENVPALLKYKKGTVFADFVATLKDAGYEHIQWSVVRCEEFGVPQKRRRLVLIASRERRLPGLKPTTDQPLSVRDAIQSLPAIEAGEADPCDPLHSAASLSEKNLERIRSSKPGGTWRDWPFELRAKCHQRESGSTYPGVYARMEWDQPSPTMTTQCYGFGNGRFGHPVQDRAISLREAALLQTFPHSYAFLPPGQKISFSEVGRWIGNAVPVSLAEAIGNLILSSEHGDNLVGRCRNLYRNFITVIAEAVSNSWDAEAQNVWIEIDKEGNTFSIKDDGLGMTAEDFQEKFLKIGYSKRKDGNNTTTNGRPFIGAKGIGKLALLSCAKRVSIYSKTGGDRYVGGVIDNADLDKAITSDNTADQYPLEQPDFSRVEELQQGHERGTIIVFDDMKEKLRSSPAHIRKMLAMSFKFSLHDKGFKIFVNGEEVSEADLADLATATEFLWLVNKYTDSYTATLDKLKSPPVPKTTALGIRGFLATVEKPRHLKITGTDERATVDLIVNGRIREKNILRHIPTQRIAESYLYGQIHFDIMDREGRDPFTSSREGVIEDDTQFQSLMDYLKRDLIPQIIDEWDGLRLSRNLEGDDENTRQTKKERKARDLFNAAKDEYKLEGSTPNKDKVDTWLDALRDDAQYNLQAYIDCFLSENLIRKYLMEKSIPLTTVAKDAAAKWQKTEAANLAKANISWNIRNEGGDLYYIEMDGLAVMAEGSKKSNGPSLWLDAVNYKPVRNAVGHTGLLSPAGKTHLNQVFNNVRARIKSLLAQP